MKKYLFVDTCIISEILEDEKLQSNFKRIINEGRYICIIGDKTLSELKKSPLMIKKFYQLTQVFDFDLSKSSNLVLKEEIATYGNKNLDPLDLSFINLKVKENSLSTFVELYIRQTDLEFALGAKREVINAIVELKGNYPPKNGSKYLNIEIINFYQTIVIQQLSKRIDFEILKSNNFKISHFKSLISQCLIVFWKFYKMKDRKPRDSDVFDISMSSCFPYINAIITENNMASDIKMIKNQKLYFKNIEKIITLKELKAYG